MEISRLDFGVGDLGALSATRNDTKNSIIPPNMWSLVIVSRVRLVESGPTTLKSEDEVAGE